jgi:hypothetical protein
MGMYTVLHLDIRLRDDLPDNIFNLLNHMLNGSGEYPHPLPDHPLFTTDTRWDYMLCSSNAYASCIHQLERHEFFGIRMCVQSSFKNYNDEINKFLNWLAPYADPDMSDNTFVGYSRYEEHTYPDVIMYTKLPDGTAKFKVNYTLNLEDNL